MSYIAIVVLALAVPPSEGNEPVVTKGPIAKISDAKISDAKISDAKSPVASIPKVAAKPTAHALRLSVRATLRKWARPTEKQTDTAAKEFLALYEQLEQDDLLAPSYREAYRSKVRGRLMRLSEQITERVARAKRREAAERRQSNSKVKRSSDSMSDRIESPEEEAVDSVVARGGGAMMNDDNGQALVDLIQTVIAPTSWDTVGGNGSIYYWRHGRAIIVRQRDDVHEQIGGLFEQMGRLNQ